MTSFVFSELAALAPEVVIGLGTMLLMVLGVMGKGGALRPVALLSALLWAGGSFYVWAHPLQDSVRLFGDTIVIDSYSNFAKLVIAGGSIAALLVALADIREGVMARFEYPVLMGFSLVGMFIMVSANDLLTLYMGLELSSLALYVLAAFDRNDARSSEAGLKYFVLGSLSSGLLLFGASLIYGYAGATQFDIIRATLSASSVPGPLPVVALFGMILVISGIAFKVAAVPFHMWTPDVYEGAPISVTAFFALVPKFAAIVLLVRLVAVPFAPMAADIAPILALMAMASMLVGAFAALIQTSLKRLMAYSSIANIGYALVGLATVTHFGYASVVMYAVIYMVMTAGTFGAITLLRRDGAAVDAIADLKGLSKTNPKLAYTLAAMMFSLSGIPPLAGFFGKLVVFQAAVAAHAYVLATFGVVTSVVAAWYYLNIIRVMFFEESEGNSSVRFAFSRGGVAVVGGSLVFVAGYALMPGPLAVAAAQATKGLLH